LVLSRPAWLDQPNPPNLCIYALIVQLIRSLGAVEGLARFLQTGEYQSVLRESPDAAASLVGQFQHPRAEEALVRLERTPLEAPITGIQLLQAIHVPTLVLANRQDPIHPFAYGETLAQAIPDAVLRELTPKSVNKEQHTRDVQRELEVFLKTLAHLLL
jgi:pimeloyl-ACP methyl ester carboxylesterase